jgi:ABC-type multidrug transport system ATPase subunit
MKSRLSIAKWMLLEPSLLLLDEPYATLDQNGAHLLESFLGDRVRAGAAVIMATHQPSRAAPLCSRAVVLEGGRLVSDDSRPEAGRRLDPLGGEPARGALWRS